MSVMQNFFTGAPRLSLRLSLGFVLAASLLLSATLPADAKGVKPGPPPTAWALPGSSPTGLADDGTWIWVTDSANLYQVDEGSGVATTFASVTDATGVCSDGPFVWVTSGSGHSLSQFDANSGSLVNTVDVSSAALSVSCDGSHEWVGTTAGLYVVDTTPAVVAGPIANYKDPHTDGTYAWALSTARNIIGVFDATTGGVLATVPVNGQPLAVISDQQYAWVGTTSGLTQINVSDFTVAANLSTNNPVTQIGSDTGFAFALTGGAVTEISAPTSTVKTSLGLAGTPSLMTVSHGQLTAVVSSLDGSQNTVYGLSHIGVDGTYNVVFRVGPVTATAPDPIAAVTGTTVTVPAFSGQRVDFTYGGWTDGSTTYQSGDTLTVGTADIELDVIWTPQVLTNKFVKATARRYATLPNGTQWYAGQLAADPAGNLYIGDSSTCRIYKVLASSPQSTPRVMANTTGTWCKGGNAYGLTYASLNGVAYLIYSGKLTPGQDTPTTSGIYLISLNGTSAPIKVGKNTMRSNLVYDAASDTLYITDFYQPYFGRYTHFSRCSAANVCTGTKVAVTGATQGAGWGIALSRGTLFFNSDSNTYGSVSINGGAVQPRGTDPNFNTMTQDPSGNVFIMNPEGAYWEVPVGTRIPIPFTFTTGYADGTAGSNFGTVYVNGRLYTVQGNTAPHAIYQIAYSLPQYTITCKKGSLTTTVTAVNPTCPAGYTKQ